MATVRVILEQRKLQELIASARGQHAKIVHDGVPYGVIQEFGSATKAKPPVPKGPAYEIYPVNKQALWWHGLAHPIPKVGPPVTAPHPGASPTPFLTPAVERNRAAFLAALRSKAFLSAPGTVIEGIAKQIARAAKAAAPRRSSDLVNSIEVSDPGDIQGLSPYAAGIEF